jgi:DNA-binding response OmpR family regulator
MQCRVLLIDDDDANRGVVARDLETHDFRVTQALTGGEGLRQFVTGTIDVVLISFRLPRMESMDLCREVRRRSALPILILGASADSHDVVAALAAGADDVVAEPIRLPELRARIGAVLRRANRWSGTVGTIRIGDLELSTQEGVVRRDGAPLGLSRTEYRLFCELAAEPGRTFSRRELVSRLWGDGYSERVVDVHVSRLRRKAERDPQRPVLLVTVHGSGYRLAG